MPSYQLVFSTTSSIKEGRRLASLVINSKLAACVSLVPSIESHYWWKGKKEKARECLLLIKTQSRKYPQLEKFLKKHHSYSVPEIIACSIDRGNKAYLRWIDEVLSGK